MPHFPLFVDLSKKQILVVGAGTIALRKIEKLVGFTTNIRVVALAAHEEVQQMAQQGLISLELRAYSPADLRAVDLVIVAVDDLALQKEIFLQAQEQKTLCNAVDSPDFCSFIFPALVQRKDLVIGISTGGKAPGVSAHVRRFISEILPANIDEIVNTIATLRKDSTQKSIKTYDEKVRRVEGVIAGLWKADGLRQKTNANPDRQPPQSPSPPEQKPVSGARSNHQGSFSKLADWLSSHFR